MWGAILTVVLQLVGWFLDRAKVSKEVKENFYKFVERAGKDLGSVKLRLHAIEQLKEFEEKEFTPEPGQVTTLENPKV